MDWLPMVTVALADVIPILKKGESAHHRSGGSAAFTLVERELDRPCLGDGERGLCVRWASRRLRRR